MPVSKLLTGAGRQSLHFFAVHRRVPNPLLRDLNVNELSTIERYLIKPELVPMIRALVNYHPRPVIVTDKRDLFVSDSGNVLKISAMSSRDIRGHQTSDEDKVICLYKLGLVLDPGEVLAWTSKIRKLTGTRHKNILLRVVHGDIFSNSRLHRFGLRDSSNCSNCPELMETIEHK